MTAGGTTSAVQSVLGEEDDLSLPPPVWRILVPLDNLAGESPEVRAWLGRPEIGEAVRSLVRAIRAAGSRARLASPGKTKRMLGTPLVKTTYPHETRLYTLEDAWLFHLGRDVLVAALSLVPPDSGISVKLMNEEVEQIDGKWRREFGRAQAELGAGPPEYQALRSVIPTS